MVSYRSKLCTASSPRLSAQPPLCSQHHIFSNRVCYRATCRDYLPRNSCQFDPGCYRIPAKPLASYPPEQAKTSKPHCPLFKTNNVLPEQAIVLPELILCCAIVSTKTYSSGVQSIWVSTNIKASRSSRAGQAINEKARLRKKTSPGTPTKPCKQQNHFNHSTAPPSNAPTKLILHRRRRFCIPAKQVSSGKSPRTPEYPSGRTHPWHIEISYFNHQPSHLYHQTAYLARSRAKAAFGDIFIEAGTTSL